MRHFIHRISLAAGRILAILPNAVRTGLAARGSFVLAAIMAGCASHPELPLAHVDMPRMYGTWYIVATIPNWFEKGMVGPRDSFSRRPDGDLQEDFYLRRGSFAALEKHYVVHDWVKANSDNAHWRVQVLWPIDLPFLVLYVDPDYRYALFGEQDRALGWIYAREPVIAEPEYRELLARFAAVGYDSTRFRKVIQLPEQVGMPGFWNEGIDR